MTEGTTAHPDGVRLGIVGGGSVFGEYARDTIDPLVFRGRAQVVAGCDVTEAGRAHLAERYPGARVTTEYRDVAEADDVDVVMVLTNAQTHAEITLAALAAGKHVLEEKPLATTLEDGRAVLAAAEAAEGFLVNAPHVILSPTYRSIWRRVRSGGIGTPLMARGFYGEWGGYSHSRWFFQAGASVLFDLGVYNVTSLTGLMGPVRRVTAMSGIAIPELEDAQGETFTVEATDNTVAVLDFGDSVFASVTTGWTMQGYRVPGIEVYGSEGVIQMKGDDWAPQGYELLEVDGEGWTVNDDARWDHWPWTDGLRHLVECLEEGTEPLITPQHAYHCMEVMIRADEAARQGQVQTIESTFPDLRIPMDDDDEDE